MTDKPPAPCHPDRPLYARGMCLRCYTREYKRTRAREDGVAATVPALVAAVMTLPEALALTEQELIQALPEAARALRRTLASDPRRGFALKAAEALLRHFPVPGGAGSRRLLEGPTKPDSGKAPQQIVIGLHVAAPGDVRVGAVVGTAPPALMRAPTKPRKV